MKTTFKRESEREKEKKINLDKKKDIIIEIHNP